jgi:adenosylhomocysteine nucleosidase
LIHTGLWKVLLAVAKKPWIGPQLLRLAKNSRLAGDNLAAVLVVLLEMIQE